MKLLFDQNLSFKLCTILYAAVPDVDVASTASARQNLRKSRISASEFIKTLEHQKLREFAAAMNGHLADL
jgi:hypothetical protein